MQCKNTSSHILYCQLESYCDVAYGLRIFGFCPSVCSYACLYVCLTYCLYVCLFLSVSLSCISVCPSSCSPVFLSVHPHVRCSSCCKPYRAIFPLETLTPDSRMRMQFTLDSFYLRGHMSHFSLFLERDYPWKVILLYFFHLISTTQYSGRSKHSGHSCFCMIMNHLQLHLLRDSSR